MPYFLWKFSELAAAAKADVYGQVPDIINGVSIDTRTLQPGDLFCAIEGETHDGHSFLELAFQKGAACALVSKHKSATLQRFGSLLAVDNVAEALRDIARAARARMRGQVIAVTGSVGKTGTKEALRLVLADQGEVHAAQASYNNHWGVPLTLSRMPQGTHFGIFEIGMNHAMEITPLAQMVRPNVAIITNIEPVHLEFFPSLWGIADAKGEIFSGIEAGGTAILNRDNPYFERVLSHANASKAGRIITFGEHEQAHIRALSITPDNDASLVTASFFGKEITFKIGMSGRHIALNMLSVLAACHATGANIDQAALSLARLQPPSGRGEQTTLPCRNGVYTLIDESYNANPASMKASLHTLAQLSAKRRIAVLGDMLELGPEAEQLHIDLKNTIEHCKIDLVFAAGNLMKNLFDDLPLSLKGGYADKAVHLYDMIKNEIQNGDVIMVKGSNGSRMHDIVKFLKQVD